MELAKKILNHLNEWYARLLLALGLFIVIFVSLFNVQLGNIEDHVTDCDDLSPNCNEVMPLDELEPSINFQTAQLIQAIGSSTTSYTYEVRTKGKTSASLDEFASLAAATMADIRGWKQTGASFNKVSSGGDFILWLSEASQVPSFSSGCSSFYSCRVGKNVIINEDRWNSATPSWNSAGGSLRDYRHMVVNHELGHFLGQGHQNCPASGQPAPIMQQQSIDLQGCTFNPWPLAFEISKV